MEVHRKKEIPTFLKVILTIVGLVLFPITLPISLIIKFIKGDIPEDDGGFDPHIG